MSHRTKQKQRSGFEELLNKSLRWLRSSWGLMYERGQGVAENLVLAHMWMNLAGAQGYELARKNMQKLEVRMTKKQIAEAQKLATEWQEKHRSLGE